LRHIDGMPYALFDRKAGRAPDELDAASAERLGMMIGRVHGVGAELARTGRVRERPRLDGETYVRRELDFLADGDWVPARLWPRYERAALDLADLDDRRSRDGEEILLHGDLHLGNVLLRDGVLRLLDFDDSVFGPPVQDLWLAIPGRDAASRELRGSLLDGYRRFREFDDATLGRVETLRGLRVVRYAAWIARRWHDPIFRATWTDFGTDEWWQSETEALEEILRFARGEGGDEAEPAAGDGNSRATAEVELTNRDYFWDWEDK
jgi:Ser/Thr protein kinase RdoA (MazF antagonist)